jgi:hypothetical protein
LSSECKNIKIKKGWVATIWSFLHKSCQIKIIISSQSRFIACINKAAYLELWFKTNESTFFSLNLFWFKSKYILYSVLKVSFIIAFPFSKMVQPWVSSFSYPLSAWKAIFNLSSIRLKYCMETKRSRIIPQLSIQIGISWPKCWYLEKLDHRYETF